MATKRPAGGRSNAHPPEEPFGPSDQGTAPKTQASQADKRAAQAKARTPSDRQVWSQLDDLQKQAYDAGRRGEPANPEWPEMVRLAHETGVEDAHNDKTGTGAGSSASAGAAPASTSRPKINISDEGATFLLGMVAYALAINYLRYGWPGVTGWLNAKFLNKVTVTGPGASVAPTPATIPTQTSPAAASAASAGKTNSLTLGAR